MTAISDVSICNLALQKLGAARITQLTDDTTSAKECNSAYENIRDSELRRYAWSFAKQRAALAASTVTPAFDFDYAFPLPDDFLRLILPPDHIDWVVERNDDKRAILSNDSGPLYIRYIARITDPTAFDPLFIDAFAAKLAWHLCERLTQSNQKKADILAEYKDLIRDARRLNAFEVLPADAVEDPWLAARR